MYKIGILYLLNDIDKICRREIVIDWKIMFILLVYMFFVEVNLVLLI